jgi:hypothetical protein
MARFSHAQRMWLSILLTALIVGAIVASVIFVLVRFA